MSVATNLLTEPGKPRPGILLPGLCEVRAEGFLAPRRSHFVRILLSAQTGEEFREAVRTAQTVANSPDVWVRGCGSSLKATRSVTAKESFVKTPLGPEGIFRLVARNEAPRGSQIYSNIWIPFSKAKPTLRWQQIPNIYCCSAPSVMPLKC